MQHHSKDPTIEAASKSSPQINYEALQALERVAHNVAGLGVGLVEVEGTHGAARDLVRNTPRLIEQLVSCLLVGMDAEDVVGVPEVNDVVAIEVTVSGSHASRHWSGVRLCDAVCG